MPKRAPIRTKDTQQLADIPKGHRPEEFADDSTLVGFLQRSIAALPKGDPQRKALRLQLRQARVAEALLEPVGEEEEGG